MSPTNSSELKKDNKSKPGSCHGLDLLSFLKSKPGSCHVQTPSVNIFHECP